MHTSLYKTALIEPEELSGLLSQPGVIVLDASVAMPGGASPLEGYNALRIPGARFFDIEDISDHDTDLPHMLPSVEEFAHSVSTLGITNGDTIIVYGQSGIVMGPARAWWMLRVFGHQDVRVLNGGLPAWREAGLAVESTLPPAPARTSYKAGVRPALVRDMNAIHESIKTNDSLILDARSSERFSGKAAEPRPGLRAGHIPGSINLPCLQLVDTKTGKMKSKEDLEGIFKDITLEKDKSIVTTCGSGVTACVIALALYELGYPDIPVYDGSWSEWGRTDSAMPVEAA
jgi:thiosulfate/3-mercaptopyruvate sulfurtransferase